MIFDAFFGARSFFFRFHPMSRLTCTSFSLYNFRWKTAASASCAVFTGTCSGLPWLHGRREPSGHSALTSGAESQKSVMFLNKNAGRKQRRLLKSSGQKKYRKKGFQLMGRGHRAKARIRRRAVCGQGNIARTEPMHVHGCPRSLAVSHFPMICYKQPRFADIPRSC